MGIERRSRKGGKSSYRAEWFDHEGTRHTETFHTLTDAKDKLRQEQANAHQIGAGLKAPPSDHHTFAQLAAYWLEHRAPEKRSGADDEATIRVHLLPVLGELDLRKLGRSELDAVRAKLEAARIVGAGPRRNQPDPGGRPYAPRTIQKILTLLGSLLRLAEDLGWIDRAPRIRKPKVPKRESMRAWLRTRDEISRFLAAAQAFDVADEQARARGEAIRGPREARTHATGVFPLYATGLYAGLRLGELAALRWSDVDLEHGRIRVGRSHDADTTKGGYVRTVPIVDALLPILTAWRLRSRGRWVFPTTAGSQRGPTDRVWREVLQQVRESAGIPRRDEDNLTFSFHSLRHTWASHLAMGGIELYTLQKLGGWKSFEMVQVYAHLLPETFDKVRGMMPAPDLTARGQVLPLAPRAAKRVGKG